MQYDPNSTQVCPQAGKGSLQEDFPLRTFIRSLAILSALAVPVAAHADTYTATMTLTDETTLSNFTIASGATDSNFVLPPSSLYTGLMIHEANTTTPISGDTLHLDISITDSTVNGSGVSTVSGLGAITISGNFENGVITWSSLTNPTIVNLSNGNSISVLVQSPVTFQPANDGSNTAHLDAPDDLTFTLLGPTAVTPEPSSLALFGTGALSLAGLLRRRIAG